MERNQEQIRRQTGSRTEVGEGGAQPHRIRLVGRAELTVEGVLDVVRFEEDTVLMETELGMLEVEGAQLRILRLDPDCKEVVLAGTVDGLLYVDTVQKKHGFGRRKRT